MPLNMSALFRVWVSQERGPIEKLQLNHVDGRFPKNLRPFPSAPYFVIAQQQK